MTTMICIACPKGCTLAVDDVSGADAELAVTGHSCRRGIDYARNEVQNPKRTVTSTVKIVGGAHRRCPVKTSGSIPKGLVIDAVRLLDDVCLRSPVRAGQVVVEDACGTGVDFVATRSM